MVISVNSHQPLTALIKPNQLETELGYAAAIVADQPNTVWRRYPTNADYVMEAARRVYNALLLADNENEYETALSSGLEILAGFNPSVGKAGLEYATKRLAMFADRLQVTIPTQGQRSQADPGDLLRARQTAILAALISKSLGGDELPQIRDLYMQAHAAYQTIARTEGRTPAEDRILSLPEIIPKELNIH